MSKQNYFIRPVWLFVLTGSALISPVYAVESSNQFNVPTQQLKALGIQTVTLGSTTGTAPNTRSTEKLPSHKL